MKTIDYKERFAVALSDVPGKNQAVRDLIQYIEDLQYRVLDLEHDLERMEVQRNMWQARAYPPAIEEAEVVFY